MRIKKGLISLFIFIGIVLLFSNGLPQDESSPKAGKNLIRKDLLFKGGEQLDLPLRNIFSPASSRRAQVGTALVQEKRNEDPEEKLPNKAAEKKEPAQPALNVRYIGFVRSKDKIVALILFRGIAYAVEKGELLEKQLEVTNVSVKEIVLTMGGFKQFNFAIEGETR